MVTAVFQSSVEVVRPDPGLARGKWEASPAFFIGIAAAAVLVPAAFYARRSFLAAKAKRDEGPRSIPPSIRPPRDPKKDAS